MNRTVWTCLALAFTVACGGAQQRSAPDRAYTASYAELPAAGDLDAWLAAEADGPEAALLRSFALEVAGRPDAALSAALEADPGLDPWIQLAVALRVEALAHAATTFEERVAPVATARAADETLHPEARLRWRALEALVAYRAHRYEMTPGLFDWGAYGVPSSWRSVGPLSSRPHLELGQPTVVDDEQRLPDVVPLQTRDVRAVHTPTHAAGVYVPREGTGIYVAETHFEVEGDGEVWAMISMPNAFIATVDGVEVARRSVDGPFAAQERWARLRIGPGVHRLRVEIAGTQDGALRVAFLGTDGATVVAADADVAGPDGTAERLDSDWDVQDRIGAHDSALSTLVAIDAAVTSGDGEPAVALLERIPVTPHPVVAYHAARLTTVAFPLDPSQRVEQALAFTTASAQGWEGALGATLELAEEYLREGQLDAAAPLLDELQRERPDDYGVQAALAAYYGERQWPELRREATARAAALFPHHCPTVADALTDRVDLGQSIAPDTLVDEWLGCDQTWRLLIRHHFLPRGEIAEAARRADILASRNPDSRQYALLAADLAEASGDSASAAARLSAFTTWSRRDGVEPAWRADALLADGDVPGAGAELDSLRARFPASVEDLLAQALIAGEAVLADYRVDGVERVREYVDAAPGYDGNAVYVYDYALYRVFEDGSGFDLVHQIVEVRTREALGAMGEVGVPAGATLLRARTIKRDGRALVPDHIPGKDSISMPNLERGDFIELAWIAPTYGPLVERPAFRSERFFFANFDGPFHESVAEYVTPESLGPVTLELRGEGVDVESETVDGLTTTTVSIRGSRPPAPDPRAVAPSEWLPSVRVGVGYDWETSVSAYENALVPLLAPTERMRAVVAELTADARNDRERVEALFRYVSDDITDFGGFFSTPASWTLESGEGERMPLFVAMLRVAGFEPDVLFVRPWDQDLAPIEVPDVAPFDLTAVRVQTDDGELWLEPDFERYPFDYLRLDGQACDAVVVAGPNAGEWVTTPRWDRDVERNAIDVDVAFDVTGDAEVTIVETLPIRAAHGLRLYVQSAEDERAVARQFQSALATSFPGVDDFDLAMDGLDDPSAPIELRYSFTTRGLARETDDGLALDGEIFARPLADWYASTPSRDRTMLISLAMIEDLSVTLRPPEGWAVTSVPGDTEGQWQDVSWSQSFSRERGVARMERSITAPIRRVEPDEYPDFARTVQALRAGDVVRIVMEPR